MARDPYLRAAVLKILRTGSATIVEVADVAGLSHQLVRHWVDQEGLDPGAARAEWLVKLWARTWR